MKLVVTFTITDGYSWTNEFTFPTEHESAEALLVEIDNELQAAVKANRLADFLGEQWNTSYFTYTDRSTGRDVQRYNLPTIQTLDEWFETCKV